MKKIKFIIMKKTYGFLFTAGFVLATAFTLSSCDSDSSKLAGYWICTDESNGEEAELFSDGTATFKAKGSSVAGTWKIVDKRFVMNFTVQGSSVSEAADYKISGYELTLVGEKGDTTVYVRKEKWDEFKAKQAAEFAKQIATCASKDYKTVKIGSQTWMAENVNCTVSGSKCYDNDEANCTKYGRLYDWKTAMSVCPKGWHLPSQGDYDVLEKAIGGKAAGKKLKAASGWNNNGNGTDEFGFSAMPGGGYSGGSFGGAGNSGYWWSSNEFKGSRAYFLYMSHNSEGVGVGNLDKNSLGSVRCVQD